MDNKDIVAALAQAYWARPAVEAELVAMAGEVARDSAAIAPSALGKGGALFNTEPTHFEALMLAEAER
ncbi:hypothetical protein G6L37_23080 [Agrobacterium rubi]|uniref:hypothetical protein n=1 Tax=Agrobacterium rubi TaxID=28099 RepID=UPI001572614F|nr:hypothetical protein [Agrobacterium rubi]NTF09014.1 hypothetical protein [Agrobacterium rubi]NTF21285.1 hypothetical protein [Agrobacterium rubi]NTF28142.1 hypothetical protein [Agrobacterium rubi]